MQRVINYYRQLTLSAKLILLTLYIALVNSYALFLVYPTLKADKLRPEVLIVGGYLLVSLPVLIYVVRYLRLRRHYPLLIVGLGGMVAATGLQYTMSHHAVHVLAIHAVFYIVAGAVEETLWRGHLWYLIQKNTSSKLFTFGAVTAHFVILHIPFAFAQKPAPIYFLVQVLGLGIALGVVRLLFKKVSMPALLHAIINMIVYT